MFKKRCSSQASFDSAKTKLKKKFQHNGFYANSIFKNKKHKQEFKSNNKTNILKIKYVNDSTSRQIRTLIRNYDLPVSLVDVPNSNLYNNLQCKPRIEKHENCIACNRLPSNYTCSSKFLVYKFTCNFCHNTYVGQTIKSPF